MPRPGTTATDGWTAPGWDAVRDAFRTSFATGWEVGAGAAGAERGARDAAGVPRHDVRLAGRRGHPADHRDDRGLVLPPAGGRTPRVGSLDRPARVGGGAGRDVRGAGPGRHSGPGRG